MRKTRSKNWLHRASTCPAVEIVDALPVRANFLLKCLAERVDQTVEGRVLLPHVLNFSNGVNHRRVVLAAKAAADLRQRGARERLAEIHRDLSWHRDRLRVISRLQVCELQLVVLGDELLNHVDRDS